MVAKRFGLAVLVAVTILAMAPLSYGQGFGLFGGTNGSNSAWCDPGAQGFWMALGARKYINSFTSYQFPDIPGGAFGTDPISRLEWPWEQVFGVAKVGWAFKTFELKAEFASTALLPSALKAQDSDWLDPANPNQKTVFSDAKAKPRGWTFDISTTIPCAGLGPLKPVVGYRVQQFKFTYTDAFQTIFGGGPGVFLPGAVIEYSQYYKHYYIGGVAEWTVDPSQYWCGSLCPAVLLRVQADYGFLKANNHDQHLYRTNDRHTYENTTGSSWHVGALVGVYSGCERKVRVDLEADFIRIRTKGTHELTDQPVNPVDLTWSGAKTWSDQAYVGISGTYFFATGCGL